MISTRIIDEQFKEMIFQEKIHHKLNMNGDAITQVRHKVKTGRTITLDYKIKLLQRAGYRFDYAEFTRKDLVEAIKFTLKTSQQARDFGAEYLLDKWLQARNK